MKITLSPILTTLSAILSKYLAMKIILTISNAFWVFSVNNSVVWDNIISNKSSTLSSSPASYLATLISCIQKDPNPLVNMI